MDHRKLLHLIAAVDTGQMVLAAQKVQLTPQAISKSIAQLEKSLGGTLLHRTAKGVFPTPLAERLLPHARLAVAEMEMLNRMSDSMLFRGKGRLTIGISPVAASDWLMAVLARFLDRYGRLQIEVAAGLDLNFREEIMAGRMDIAFAVDLNASREDDGLLLSTEFGREHWVVAGRADHPKLQVARQLSDLDDQSWILGRNAAAVDAMVAEDFRASGLSQLRARVKTTSLEATHSLLGASDLISILPSRLVANWADVQGVDLAEGRWQAPLCMMRRSKMAGDPLLNELAASVAASAPK